LEEACQDPLACRKSFGDSEADVKDDEARPLDCAKRGTQNDVSECDKWRQRMTYVRKKNTATRNHVWWEGKRYRKHLRVVQVHILLLDERVKLYLLG
jgi:hypothetical protein